MSNLPITRREALSGAATGGVVATTGCLESEKNPRTSRWALEQTVRVHVERGGTTHMKSLAMGRAKAGGKVLVGIAEEYSELADEVGNISVNDEMHEQLEGRFDRVKYSISLCTESTDCRGGETTRKNFNKITWDSEVRASYLLRGWRVISVDTADEIRNLELQHYEEFSMEDWPES